MLMKVNSLLGSNTSLVALFSGAEVKIRCKIWKVESKKKELIISAFELNNGQDIMSVLYFLFWRSYVPSHRSALRDVDAEISLGQFQRVSRNQAKGTWAFPLFFAST